MQGMATRPLIFTGVVTFATTKADGADRATEIELVDNRIEVRDTYVSVLCRGCKLQDPLIQDTADQMGVTVSFSYNAEFKDILNGYSYVGPARNVLTKARETSGLTWSINNGVLQVKKPGDTMSREVYELWQKRACWASQSVSKSPMRTRGTATAGTWST